ncbi:ESX-1 secretion-associated protein EspK-like [Anopheles ziemanni]|uniref:ESX-1 secretion-associated protein EspK-like n=1 Tax=Anopheles coustani TaxID=139045 RepID=UPI00265A6CFE|nr:ESX-1 secretion-associated protein EspK-like [Anopheles coustani]XP_058176293.1 ESX-1 secretion-associated protein EspK-like [Anopheles ziemanni]
MNKLIVGSLFLLFAGHLAAASMFGPFGPFAQPAGGAAGGAAFPGFPARPGVGQLPFFPPQLPFFPPQQPFFPASPFTPAVVPVVGPVVAPALGRALPAPVTPTLPPTAGGNLRTVVSASDVVGRLAVADLPEDLQQRAQELQAASEAGFDACEELLQLPGAFWQYKRCNAFQLRNVLTAAKALEQEATARAAAAAAAAATEAAVATEAVEAPAAVDAPVAPVA